MTKAQILIRWRKAWTIYFLLAFSISGAGTSFAAANVDYGWGLIIAGIGFSWVAFLIYLNGPEKFELVDSDG